MHQIAPFYHFSRGSMSPEPPSTSFYFIKLITYNVIFVFFLAKPYLYMYIRKYIKRIFSHPSCIASLFRHLNKFNTMERINAF